MKELYCRVSPSISPYYGFVHSGKNVPMSVPRNLPVQLLCFVDKETEDQRENVSCSSHMVKSVAEQKLELRIRASSYFHTLSLHSLVLLPQRGRKTSFAGELCPSLFFSQPFCLSLGCQSSSPKVCMVRIQAINGSPTPPILLFTAMPTRRLGMYFSIQIFYFLCHGLFSSAAGFPECRRVLSRFLLQPVSGMSCCCFILSETTG